MNKPIHPSTIYNLQSSLRRSLGKLGKLGKIGKEKGKKMERIGKKDGITSSSLHYRTIVVHQITHAVVTVRTLGHASQCAVGDMWSYLTSSHMLYAAHSSFIVGKVVRWRNRVLTPDALIMRTSQEDSSSMRSHLSPDFSQHEASSTRLGILSPNGENQQNMFQIPNGNELRSTNYGHAAGLLTPPFEGLLFNDCHDTRVFVFTY